MALGVKQIRSSIEADMKALLEMDVPAALKESMNSWIAGKDDAEASKKASRKFLLQ